MGGVDSQKGGSNTGANDAKRSKIYDELVASPKYKNLIRKFASNLPKSMEKLEQTFKQANWEQLAITAHGLKGSGGTFGYPEITEIAGRLEQAAFSADGVTAEATISELRMRVTEIVDSAEETPPITKADNDTGRDKPVL